MYCFPSVNGTIEKTINIGLEIRRHIAERFFSKQTFRLTETNMVCLFKYAVPRHRFLETTNVLSQYLIFTSPHTLNESN